MNATTSPTTGNGREYQMAAIRGKEYPQIALDLFRKLTKAHGYRKPLEGESDEDYRAVIAEVCESLCGIPVSKFPREWKKNPSETPPTVRYLLESAVAFRWGCVVTTLRKWFSLGRSPGSSKHQFFRDLVEYGGVEFTKDGTVKRGTTGKGPDREYFNLNTPSGYVPADR